jgi:UDP-N-acetylglucosamine 1-carboxyvinyltransferase
MDRIRIVGGNQLNGTIAISGAKNAALPLMIAALLTDETLILDNVPRLADVAQLQRILGNHGVDITAQGKRVGDREHQGQTLHISAANVIDMTAPYDLVSRMRASFWVIAPLIARMREAKVSLPGGCAIGTRPVDLLIMALEKLGAEILIDGGYVIARAPQGLRGAQIEFPKVTVGGTQIALMAATLASGTTTITNAACEPEIADVAACLNKMGARIAGAGSSRILVEGVERLHGARHAVLPDRIEAGTYAIAAAMTAAVAVGSFETGWCGNLRQRRRHSRCAQRRRNPAREGRDRAVSRFSNRFAGAIDGAHGVCARRIADHRNDFRKPLHACAGTGALRREDLAQR